MISVMVLYASSSSAGFYGRLDSRLQSDSYYDDSDVFFQQYAELHYEDKSRAIESAMNLSLRQDEGAKQQVQLYQLYLEKRDIDSATSYRLGRFERADSLGFYTLDGVVLDSVREGYSLAIYAGQPQQIDEFDDISGDAVYGVEFQFRNLLTPANTRDNEFQRSYASIGLQRLDEGGEHETRLDWGLSLRGDIDSAESSAFGLDMNAVYLMSERDFESIGLELFSDIQPDQRVLLDYDSFRLSKPYLSFSERFYSLYALGRQSNLSVIYQLNPAQMHQWQVRARMVRRELGENGYGLTLGYLQRSDSGENYRTQLDYLKLDQDMALSLYGSCHYSISAVTRARFGGALQHQDKWLTGSNDTLAFEARVERFMSSGVYLSVSASRIENSHADDDYLFALNLSYRFEGATTGWSDE